MAEWIGIGLTGVGIALKAPEVIRNVISILGSREALANAREQQKEFSSYLKAVRRRTRRMHARNPARLPRKLFEVVKSLTDYCDKTVEQVIAYHEKYLAQFSVRFTHWVNLAAGKDLATFYKRRLRECEDWLAIANGTIYLYTHVDQIQQGDRVMFRACVDRCSEIHRLLSRVTDYQKQHSRRMRHMNRDVETKVLYRSADLIANDRAFIVLAPSEGGSNSSCCISHTPSPVHHTYSVRRSRDGAYHTNIAWTPDVPTALPSGYRPADGGYSPVGHAPVPNHVDDATYGGQRQASPEILPGLLDNRPYNQVIQPPWREQIPEQHSAEFAYANRPSQGHRTWQYPSLGSNERTHSAAPEAYHGARRYSQGANEARARHRDTSTSRNLSSGIDSGYGSVQSTPQPRVARPFYHDSNQQTPEGTCRPVESEVADLSEEIEPLNRVSARSRYVQGQYTPNPAPTDTSVPIYPVTVRPSVNLPASNVESASGTSRPRVSRPRREGGEQSGSRRYRSSSMSSTTSRGNCSVRSQDSGYASGRSRDHVRQPANKYYPPQTWSNKYNWSSRETPDRTRRPRSSSSTSSRQESNVDISHVRVDGIAPLSFLCLSLVYVASTESTPSIIWRIGDFDGQPFELKNGNKITRMHPSDVRMGCWGGTYTAGKSSPADFTMALFSKTGATATVNFNLAANQVSNLVLGVGTTLSFKGGRPSVKIESWTGSDPGAPKLIDSRGVTRGAYRGYGEVYTWTIPANALRHGTNTLTLGVPGCGDADFLSANYILDAIELQGQAGANSPKAYA